LDLDETILIIDDDRALQQSCRQVFAGNNYTVESAFDGVSGLEKFETLKPDLVLVDLCMPGLGGIEVLEKLKSKDPECVAIIITAYGTISYAVEAMKRGAYDFIPKPFTPDQLRFIVRRGLERRRFVTETARLKREKQLMRDNFVSMVSHELRAPLAAVQQKLMLVTGGYAGEISEEAARAILGMQERIERLLTLIGDWLSLARIDAGEILMDTGPVDLRSVLGEAVETLRPLAQEKGVSLGIEPGNSVPPIDGNRETLTMLFSNLIDNAIKYNREGGSVDIRFETETGNVRVTIRDTGTGMPQETLPLIFEQFYRVKGDGGTRGSGLGLSISRRIAELHGGSIAAESEVGKGSVFTVRLPVSHDS
jgi:two-component system sensor histidine kinase/response regulator